MTRIIKNVSGRIEEGIAGSLSDVTFRLDDSQHLFTWESARIWFEKSVKRMVDIILAILFLSVGSPMFFLIGIAVKLSSKGPVFFRQERIGLHGRRFCIYKFRTMRPENSQEEHQEYIQKLLHEDVHVDNDKVLTGYFDFVDSRTTAVGKFLRATSLDELPQFINILKGDMSFVGPRPHPTYEVKEYKHWYHRRLSVKPGLTGWSKLNLRLTPKNYEESILYDLWYVDNWSVILDFQIILMTVPFVLSMKDAH